MKKIYLACLFPAFAITACYKSEHQKEKYETIEVVELKSNKPVGNAVVTLYKCTNYDFVFGCTSIGVLSVYSTDINGNTRIRSADYNQAFEGITISKAGYWTQDAHMGKNELCPEGWIQLNIKRTSNYPDSLYFFLFNVEERYLLTSSEGMRVLKMKQRADTTVLIRAFGSQKNTLLWKVGEENILPYGPIIYSPVASGSLPAINLPANNTINLSLDY